MSLAQKAWIRVTMHHVILAWLRAERNTNVAAALSRFPWLLWAPGISKLLDSPDLNDSEENRARLRIMYLIRNVFVLEIPPDTEWYNVRSLTDSELSELHTVNYQTWNDPADQNELRNVAARKPLVLNELPSKWETPILWGHDRNGPFTILEGNNRLTAYAGSAQSGLDIPVLIGLSPMRCHWHLLDRSPLLIYDLIMK
ncbi:hypothetical protein [Bradyrhizobium sp. SZCCHNRI1073]|uniref:hypothetical protein n=1 Tax=Bradyrhizobium sp. SZCCHNRI1073 TaxID=3057280 RepID=UPI0029166668|nr:hypothetical protein [Bradyrhizobium sp. SZCCHNRI1073]